MDEMTELDTVIRERDEALEAARLCWGMLMGVAYPVNARALKLLDKYPFLKKSKVVDKPVKV